MMQDDEIDSGNESSEFYIGLEPQLNFGGRSIFWSGLIPAIQPWELQFFPPNVRNDLMGLVSGLLNRAGDMMNESRSMGFTAEAVVSALRQSPLAADFPSRKHPGHCTSRACPRRHTATGVLHRAHGRVHHRRADRQSGRPHARKTALQLDIKLPVLCRVAQLNYLSTSPGIGIRAAGYRVLVGVSNPLWAA